MLLVLTGCKKDTKESKDSSDASISNIKITDDKASLTIKEETLTNKSAILIIKNNSTLEANYEDLYWIEKEKDGNWYKVETIKTLNFNSPAHILKSNESKEIEIDWEDGYGKLTSGKYRIIKKISIETEKDTKEDFYIAAEFTIK